MDYLIYNPKAFGKRVEAVKKWKKKYSCDYKAIAEIMNSEEALKALDSFTRAVDNLISCWDEYKKRNWTSDRRASVFWAIELELYCYASYCRVVELNPLDEKHKNDGIYELFKWITDAYGISRIYLSADELNELADMADLLEEMYEEDEDDYSDEERKLLKTLKKTKWYEEWWDDWQNSYHSGAGTEFVTSLFEEDDCCLKLVDYFAKR